MRQRDHDLVLVVDFGAQYAQLIARRVREAKVYSEIVPHTATAAEILARQPKAIILSGGPSSVYEPGAPRLDGALVDSGTPVLGICYGFQAMARVLGGSVAHTGMREYGRTTVSVTDSGVLLAGLPAMVSAWMSARRRGDRRPARLRGDRNIRSCHGRRLRGPRSSDGRPPVAPGSNAHRTRPAGSGEFLVQHRWLHGRLDGDEHH